MKYIFFFLTMWAMTTNGQSQTDTVYFDQYWKKCSRENFIYFRTVIKTDSSYQVTDHYKDGSTQMEGVYSSLNPEVKNGPFKYYYMNGHKKQESDYKNNKREGAFKTYDSIMGMLTRYTEYKDGKRNGEDTRYAYHGIKKTSIYANDSLIEGDGNKDQIPKSFSPDFKGMFDQNFEFGMFLKKNIPDSLRNISCELKVKFHINDNGKPSDIIPLTNDNKSLTDLVIKSILNYGKWHGSVVKDTLKGTNCIIIIQFPAMNITISLGDTPSSTVAANFPDTTRNEANRKLRKYIKRKYEIADVSKDTTVKGEVSLTFNIDSTGETRKISVTKYLSPILESFIIRMVKEYPDWKDFIRPKATSYNLSVNFPEIRISTGYTYNSKANKQ